MNNKTIKKIQLGGWSKRPFSEIRKKVELMDEVTEEKHPYKKRSTKKCRGGKEHQFVLIKQTEFMNRYKWSQYECTVCGKNNYR